MTDTDQEAQWLKQFEGNGRDAVRIFCRDGSYNGPMRLAAFRWLREKEIEGAQLAVNAHWYSKLTFWAAVAAVIVGVIGVVVTLYWH